MNPTQSVRTKEQKSMSSIGFELYDWDYSWVVVVAVQYTSLLVCYWNSYVFKSDENSSYPDVSGSSNFEQDAAYKRMVLDKLNLVSI